MFARSFEEIQIGESAELVKRITEADVRKFVEMTGDDNPLHVDRAYAETTPMKDIVVHGMLGASFISTIIGTKLPGEGALWLSQSFDFLLPVRLNDELTISCTVAKKFEKERLIELEAKAVNQNKGVVFTGRGKVKLLETQKTQVEVSNKPVLAAAIVTGATGGIGREICFALAREGFPVVVNFRSRPEVADTIVAKIKESGGRAVALKADVMSSAEVERLVQASVKAFSGVSVLVNNASPKINPQPFDQLEWSAITNQVDAQCGSAFMMAKACVPYMKQAGKGKIINLTSQVIDGVPTTNWTSYAIGKSALSTFSKYLASELGPHGINVNCVSPGMTDTAMVGDIPEKLRLIIARQAPLRRLANPTDVAEAVAFLASSKADYLTGETLRVNGGQVML